MEEINKFPAHWDKILINQGVAHLYYAFDVGFSINLEEADRRIRTQKQRRGFKLKKSSNKYCKLNPAPLNISMSCPELGVTPLHKTLNVSEALICEFGAISICLQVPFSGKLDHLLRLSQTLYDNSELIQLARSLVQNLVNEMGPAISKVKVSDHVEDYYVFQIEKLEPSVSVDTLLNDYPDVLSCLLRGDPVLLSQEEVSDILFHRVSYGQNDVTLVDWDTAIIYGQEMEDVCTVLEYTNVFLNEFLFLEGEINKALNEFYDYFSLSNSFSWWPTKSRHTQLRKISQFQLDSDFLLESVTNAMKLFDDVFLARLYKLSYERLKLNTWENSIERKMQTVESIYQKFSDAESTRRLEILEWVIIILIAVSILIPFLPGMGKP